MKELITEDAKKRRYGQDDHYPAGSGDYSSQQAYDFFSPQQPGSPIRLPPRSLDLEPSKPVNRLKRFQLV